jgi:hypothetical protein
MENTPVTAHMSGLDGFPYLVAQIGFGAGFYRPDALLDAKEFFIGEKPNTGCSFMSYPGRYIVVIKITVNHLQLSIVCSFQCSFQCTRTNFTVSIRFLTLLVKSGIMQ